MLDEVEAEEARKKKGKKETKCAGNGKETMMESQGNSGLDEFLVPADLYPERVSERIILVCFQCTRISGD
jgi:hypothetical protein